MEKSEGLESSWELIESSPPHIASLDLQHKTFALVGVVNRQLVLSGENGTYASPIQERAFKKWSSGKVVATFGDVIFLQKADGLIRYRVDTQETLPIPGPTSKFFPLSSDELLQVKDHVITFWEVTVTGFRKVWEGTRDPSYLAWHARKIGERICLVGKKSEKSFFYSTLNSQTGDESDRIEIKTPHVLPISGNRFLTIAQTERESVLSLRDHQKPQSRELQRWAMTQVHWIDSNEEWAILHVGDKMAIISLKLDEEQFVGTFPISNATFTSSGELLLYTDHTLHLHDPKTLVNRSKIELKKEELDSSIEDFRIHEVRPVKGGCVVDIRGITKGRESGRFFKEVPFKDSQPTLKATPLNPNSPPQLVTLPKHYDLRFSLKWGVTVITSQMLWHCSPNGEVTLQLPCETHEVVGDWASIKIGEQWYLQRLNVDERKICNGGESNRFVLPSEDGAVVRVKQGEFILERGTKINSFRVQEDPIYWVKSFGSKVCVASHQAPSPWYWVRLIDVAPEKGKVLTTIHFNHSEICLVGDFILGFRGEESLYFFSQCLSNINDSTIGKNEIPSKDFKWLSEDGVWALGLSGGELYLVNGANPAKYHTLEAKEGAKLLGNGLLARWEKEKVEIWQIGGGAPIQEETFSTPILEVIREGEELVCLTKNEKKDPLSFQIEKRKIGRDLVKAELPRKPNSQKKVALLAFSVFTLLAYYSYLRLRKRELTAPARPITDPLPLPKPPSPPKRVPVRVRGR